ncbi:MAG: YXWGXW repeat-containing protein [Bryobacterales bacterium]|nr:YXWGXW repeat-containing protein [Bryobacterales bacterium]
MSTKSVILSAILLGSSAMAACGGGYVAYRVPAPPAPYVVGAVGYAPGPGYVWVDGYWDLHGTRWAWVNGRWAVPPRGHRIWVADRWERHGENWRFRRGRWR